MKDLRFIHDRKIKPHSYIEDKQAVTDFHDKGKKYNNKYKKLGENKSEYHKFSLKDNSNVWKVFKDAFLILSGGLCPVCEQDISNYDDIEHFRPKQHYWWLAYDYKNYAPYCKLCNSTYKRTQFPLLNNAQQVDFKTKLKINNEKPLLFNPLKDNPLELFQIRLFYKATTGKGELHFEPLESLNKNSYQYKKAKTTIDLYNLNNHIKQDTTRYNRLSNRFGDVQQLVDAHKSFKINPYKKNEIEYFKILKNMRINKKLGITEFITKQQYK